MHRVCNSMRLAFLSESCCIAGGQKLWLDYLHDAQKCRHMTQKKIHFNEKIVQYLDCVEADSTQP